MKLWYVKPQLVKSDQREEFIFHLIFMQEKMLQFEKTTDFINKNKESSASRTLLRLHRALSNYYYWNY